MSSPTSAIVLCGGRSRRMGFDKGSCVVAGRSMLERTIDALAGAVDEVVVVAPPADLRPGALWPTVSFVLEDPPFGGPVAGLVAGLSVVSREEVIVVAVDLVSPRIVVAELVSVPAGAAGIVPVDEEGWPQYLAGRYRTAALRERAASTGVARDASVRRFMAGLSLAHVPVASAVVADADTPADLAALTAREGGQHVEPCGRADRG